MPYIKLISRGGGGVRLVFTTNRNMGALNQLRSYLHKIMLEGKCIEHNPIAPDVTKDGGDDCSNKELLQILILFYWFRRLLRIINEYKSFTSLLSH